MLIRKYMAINHIFQRSKKRIKKRLKNIQNWTDTEDAGLPLLMYAKQLCQPQHVEKLDLFAHPVGAR